MTTIPATAETVEASQTLERFPFDDGRGIDVNERYRELRERDGLLKVQMAYGEPTWLITRYADARLVLGDARFSRYMSVGRDYPRQAEAQDQAGLITLDAPEHSRLRTLLLKAFNRSRIDAQRPAIRALAESLLAERMAAGAGMDLVGDYAQQISVLSVCDLLGVPATDRENFELTSMALLPSSTVGPEETVRRFAALRDYTAQFIDDRRARPQDDLMSAMIQARDNDDRLTDTELIDLVVGLLLAGFEAITTQLPNCVYTLQDNNRVLWDKLRAAPETVPAAIEELLRYIASSGAGLFVRYALEDIEVGGTLVRAGEACTVANEAANHDPAKFENPDTIDFTRQTAGHLSFGHGVHHCAGAQLARIDLQEGLLVLLERAPELAIRDVQWKELPHVRGPEAMRVTWHGGAE